MNTFKTELGQLALPENTEKPSTNIDGLSDTTLQLLVKFDCIDLGGKLKYNIIKANGCVYLVDPLKPDIQPCEQAVYPYHDEAAELLKIASSLEEHFDTVIDAFGGGGHSNLPILQAGIADKSKSIDINPRAVHLSRANSKINGLEDRTGYQIGDTTKELPPKEGKTLFIANPPFALAVQGVQLDQMRDGGENGLVNTNAYLAKSIQAAENADVIIGVAYSRIGFDGRIELEQKIREILSNQGRYILEIVEGEKLWRGPNGRKEQPNPMPLDNMYTKADPGDLKAVEAYNRAAAFHKEQGWDRLGYFRYIIHINETSTEASATRVHR